jgi:hypothetical protein
MSLTFTFQPIAYRPSLTFEFRQPGLYCTASVTLDDAVGSAECEFDVNILRKLTASAFIDYEQGQAVTDNLHIITQQAQFNSASVLCEHQNGQLIIVDTVSDLQQMALTRIEHHTAQQQATLLIQWFCSLLNISVLINRHFCFTEQDGVLLSNSVQSVQDVLAFITTQTHDNKQQALQQLYTLCINTPYSLFLSKRFCDKKQQAKPPPFGKNIHIGGRPKPEPQPPNHITYHIPIRETYAMQHTIIVKTVADNQALELKKISLSYDAESYAWQFSGTLAYIADLSRFNLTDFEPVQLSISIDGHVWLVVVEELPENKSFGKIEIQLTGRSLSALLGEPWSQINSYLQGSEMTVQQLADSLIPFDWTIDWQCPTWLLPANTYSHTQQSPLQSLKTIANNIGAVLYPVPDSKTLRVQPRYPVLPWNYNLSGMNPDVVIPDDAVLSMGIKSRVASPINGVYVHGTTADGILGRCVLSGTAGDVLAATESNSLITDVVGARALGERVLAGKYTQPTISTLTTFLGGDFPLFDVGMLVLANGEKATVTGVSIDVEFGTVRQHLTFGENMTNVYARFLSVLPKTPLLVGTVVSNYGENSIMSLIGGGVIAARGTGTVGQNYYVRNGVIETQAPNLTAFEIVI